MQGDCRSRRPDVLPRDANRGATGAPGQPLPPGCARVAPFATFCSDFPRRALQISDTSRLMASKKDVRATTVSRIRHIAPHSPLKVAQRLQPVARAVTACTRQSALGVVAVSRAPCTTLRVLSAKSPQCPPTWPKGGGIESENVRGLGR